MIRRRFMTHERNVMKTELLWKKIERLFKKVKRSLTEDENDVINAYDPELCSKHRLRLSTAKKHFTLKVRQLKPLKDFAVLVNDSQFLIFFFSICTAMN